MGPIILFDKSFLQSLNLDEAVFWDHFFLTNICPMFFVETLADLNKTVDEGQTPEKEVAIIAHKTPEMNGFPNQFHLGLCIGDLMGYQVPMTGQIPIRGGHPIKQGNQSGIFFEEPSESRALKRWKECQFWEVEQVFARQWRQMLALVDIDKLARELREIGIKAGRCKTLNDAKNIAEAMIIARNNPTDRIRLAFWLLGIPKQVQKDILLRWKFEEPPLIEFAPYASFVLSIQIFFHIARAAELISKKPSTIIDISYLFYLLFCMIFTSSDRLHERCAPLFLRSNQEFIPGKELKEDLNRIVKHFDELPEVEKEKGLNEFAATPPEGDFLITKLWDNHLPNWRRTMKPFKKSTDADQKFIEYIKDLEKVPELKPEEIDFDLQKPDFVTIQIKTSKRRGKWWQLPKDLPEGD